MMKRMNNFVKQVSMTCFVLAAVAWPIFAQQADNDNQLRRVFDASGVKTVQIVNDQPVHVTFIGSDTDSLVIQRLYDKEAHVKYSVSRNDGTLILSFSKTELGKQMTDREDRMTWIDHLLSGDWHHNEYRERKENEYQVTLPRNLSMDIQTNNSYLGIHRMSASVSANGSDNHFDIDSLGSDLKIEGGDQRVTGNGVGGAVSIDNHDGSVDLRSVSGPVNVKTHDSHISLQDVRNSLNLSITDGSCDIRNIRGGVHLEGDNLRMNLTGIHGAVSATGKDDHLDASDIQSLKFNGSDAWISVNHVNGNEGVIIKNSDGTVKLDEIRGPVDITGSDLGVTLNYLHGKSSFDLSDSHISGYKLMDNTSLRGDDTSINLKEYQGSKFTSESGSGSIDLTMTSRVDSVDIRRNSGDVTIRMLEPFNGGYRLLTKRGRVTWTGRQNAQIRPKGDEMELSGGNKDNGYINIELDRGYIRIN